MSVLPCDGCGHVVHGRLLGFYPAMLHNGTRTQNKLRLCGECLVGKLSQHRDDWRDSTMLQRNDPKPHCYSCQHETDDVTEYSRFFLTAYVAKDQRRDYQAYYCRDCAAMVSGELKLHV